MSGIIDYKYNAYNAGVSCSGTYIRFDKPSYNLPNNQQDDNSEYVFKNTLNPANRPSVFNTNDKTSHKVSF